MLNSIRKNKVGILLMLFSSLCACMGQTFWKLSDKSFYFLILGFFFYGIGAIIMLVAYRYGSLSVLQPILSLNYVLALIIGYLVFNEIFSPFRLVGVLFILCGVLFICSGD